MLIVIQCAKKKSRQAAFLRSNEDKPVCFVADPVAAPRDNDRLYARPDDPADADKSWRAKLLRYNAEYKARGTNQNKLLMAYKLYEHQIYTRLADKFGVDQVYILSAGWGLIRADFLTPYYDITFSAGAERWERRRPTDVYDDFSMMEAGLDDQVVFFGGKDYVPLFCKLTESIKATKTVFYNSDSLPRTPGCKLQRYHTATKTNWHYKCASDFIEGKVSP